MPFKSGFRKLANYDGPEVKDVKEKYMMAIGDLMWLTKTHPELLVIVQHLASFMQNPGPEQVKAVRHVLKYLIDHKSDGLTFHGNESDFESSFPILFKLTGLTDASFYHNGDSSIAGISILLNGAAIYFASKRITTACQTTIEFEIKAAAALIERVYWVMDLWAEFMHQKHPTIRVLIDNQAALSQSNKIMDTKK